jgi:hypothetical protein
LNGADETRGVVSAAQVQEEAPDGACSQFGPRGR